MINQFDLSDKNIYKILDLLNISIYWKDLEGRYLGCNKYMLDMDGVSSRKEIIGKTDYDLLTKEDADRVTKVDKFVIENGSYNGEELTIVNGEERIYFTSKTKILDDNGNVIGVFGTSTDITDTKKRMKLEKQQLNEQAKVQQIIDTINASIYWKDEDGKYLGCNKFMFEKSGFFSREQLIGKTEYDILPKDEAEQIIRFDKFVVENGNYNGEEIATISNGETRTYFSSKSQLLDTDGNVIGIVGTSLDITAQKEAERIKFENEKQQTVLNEQRKTMQLIDLVNASIYWKDKDGKYLGCNKYVLNMDGLTSREEILGKSVYDLLSKDEADKIVEVDKLVIEKGYYDGEESVTISSGEKRTYFTSKSQLLDEQGNFIGIIGTSIDITAQKEAEQLRLENAEHQAAAAEQEKFRKKAEQVIHDVQSPLSSLRTAVTAYPEAPEQLRIMIRDSTLSIGDIVNNLSYEYQDSNIENEQSQSLLVSSALLEVLSEKRYEYKDINVEFETKFNPGSDFAFTAIKPSDFKRMISNLLNNAVQALDNKADGKVMLSLEVDTQWVIITIEDNGKGIPEETIAKIRNNIRVTEGKDNGHGIGLGQVRDTISDNLGEFDIYSTFGIDTTVIIKLPKIPAPIWIATTIKVFKDDLIIVVDDDSSIHGAWDARFKPILEEYPTIKIKHFSVGADAVCFMNGLADEEKAKICLLTDYELLRQDLNGLDIIEQTKIKRATLVTSHYANSEIRNQAIMTHTKILPKNLAFAVAIIVDKQIEPGSRIVDFVWLDDDQTHINSVIEAHYSHLKVDKYFNPYDFLDNVAYYPFNTKIFLDNFYYTDIRAGIGSAYNITGVEIAKQLHEQGYTNLYLISGQVLEQIPNYLTVILKSSNNWENTLDKL